MKFIEEVKKLQEEFKGHVVLVKCGIFYTAIGKDAIILHELLGMHLICMKEKLCKSGVLDKNIDKFIKEMDERNLSFVICDYDKNKMGTNPAIFFTTTGKYGNCWCCSPAKCVD